MPNSLSKPCTAMSPASSHLKHETGTQTLLMRSFFNCLWLKAGRLKSPALRHYASMRELNYANMQRHGLQTMSLLWDPQEKPRRLLKLHQNSFAKQISLPQTSIGMLSPLLSFSACFSETSESPSKMSISL